MQHATTTHRLGAIALTAILFLVGAAGTAAAGVSFEDTFEIGYVYTDGFGVDEVLLTGPPLEQGCFGEGFPSGTGRTAETPAERTNTRNSTESDMWLYDMAEFGVTDPFEFLFLACTQIATGGPIPVPLASGSGTVRLNEHCDWTDAVDGCFSPGSVLHYTNSAQGTMTSTASGDVFDVHARAKGSVTFVADGPPVEDVQILFLRKR